MAIAPCVILVAVAAGCSAKADAPAEPITIAWMSKDATNTFFDASRKGATLAGQELSAASGRQVNVQIMDPATNSGDAEVAQIEAAILAKVQAIDVDVTDVAKVGPAIDKAIDAGIKVLTFDSDAQDSKRLTYYGIDNVKAGQMSAQLLTQLMGGSGGKIAVMVLENPPTAGNFIQRVKGFTDELANHPGFEIVVTLPCTDAVEVKMQAGCTGGLEATMTAFPEVTGWYLARGRILREANLATEAPNWTAKMLSGDFKAVSFDAIPASNANIKAGYVNAVIQQKVFGWGYDVVTLTYDVLAHGRQVLPFTDSQFDVVCSNNIDDVISAWTALDFRTAIPKCSLLP
jgi:ribose transport system substrate-binding protein